MGRVWGVSAAPHFEKVSPLCCSKHECCVCVDVLPREVELLLPAGVERYEQVGASVPPHLRDLSLITCLLRRREFRRHRAHETLLFARSLSASLARALLARPRPNFSNQKCCQKKSVVQEREKVQCERVERAPRATAKASGAGACARGRGFDSRPAHVFLFLRSNTATRVVFRPPCAEPCGNTAERG